MRKLAPLAAAGLLALAATLPVATASADGPECNLYSHCYGIANYASGSVDAVAVDLWTDCLHLDTPNQDLATHEMWMMTNASPPAAAWIEGGYMRGFVAGGDPQSWFRWTWAEGVGGNYYSHFVNWASVADWKQLWFTHFADNKWGIYLGGSHVGTTAQTATLGTYVQVGAETTEPQVYSHGKSRGLQWHPPGGPWVSGSGPIVGATSGVYSVAASGQAMEQTSLQNACSSAPAAVAKADAPSETDLRDVAVKVAAMHGEKKPAGIAVVKSKRGAAQRLVGGGAVVDTDQAVHVIRMSGDFVGSAPKGAPLPRGNTMTITVDAANGEVTDLSISRERKDLSKLGAVKQL